MIVALLIVIAVIALLFAAYEAGRVDGARDTARQYRNPTKKRST